MGEGVQVGRGVFDLPGLAGVEDRVVALERQARALHAERLRALLDLHARHDAAGVGRRTTSVWAVHTDSGEHAARALLDEALLLGALRDGLDAVATGLLGVPHCRAVAELLGPLDPEPRRRVWELLVPRLRADLEHARPRPPARLRELLHRLVRRVDAEGAEERRRQAREAAGVVLRRRDDGLVDLFANGLSAFDARAVDDRLTRLAHDGDPAVELGRRKVDALRDLVLGRLHHGADDPSAAAVGRCGCVPGSGPCGVEVQVLVPLQTALDRADDPAHLVGHGVLASSELRRVLVAAPALRAVWVDGAGVPVAVAERTVQAGRGEAGLRRGLGRLLDLAPPPLHPRHPDDHAPRGEPPLPLPAGLPPSPLPLPDGLPPPPGTPTTSPPLPPVPLPRHGDDMRWWDDLSPLEEPEPDLLPDVVPDLLPDLHPDRDAGTRRRPAVRQHPHPVTTAGSYAPTVAQRRLVRVRSPRCEWPGCGARAALCDLDHDVAWPQGPTCSCNLGPLCRHHHQVKQLGWTKERQGDGGVRWTGPTGRAWVSPPQPDPP